MYFLNKIKLKCAANIDGDGEVNYSAGNNNSENSNDPGRLKLNLCDLTELTSVK